VDVFYRAGETKEEMILFWLTSSLIISSGN